MNWILSNYKVSPEVYLVETMSGPSNIYHVKPSVVSRPQSGETGHLSHFFESLPEFLENVEDEPRLAAFLSCANNQEQVQFDQDDLTHTLLPLVNAGICVAVLVFPTLNEESLNNVKRILDIIAKGLTDIDRFGMILFSHCFL
jgi:hypothetical protein